jgi:6-phosphogluconolactonase
MVSAFALDAKTGKLTLLNQLPALGEDPCYISFDKTGKYALVANYTSGNIAVFPILANGRLGEHTALATDSGTTGPNKERQVGPHAHWTEASPDNRFVLSVDLGLDEIVVHGFDAETGSLTLNGHQHLDHFKLRAGSGPRHLAFSQDGRWAFVVNELASTVTWFIYDALRGAFVEITTASTLPKGFSSRNDTAEIAVHPSGKFLYASNRGHDSIAIFSIDPPKGTLRSVARTSTGGKEPRHFAIDPTGKFLLAENQLSNDIVVFKIDPATGALAPTGQVVDVPSPVCIAFVPAE